MGETRGRSFPFRELRPRGGLIALVKLQVGVNSARTSSIIPWDWYWVDRCVGALGSIVRWESQRGGSIGSIDAVFLS